MRLFSMLLTAAAALLLLAYSAAAEVDFRVKIVETDGDPVFSSARTKSQSNVFLLHLRTGQSWGAPVSSPEGAHFQNLPEGAYYLEAWVSDAGVPKLPDTHYSRDPMMRRHSEITWIEGADVNIPWSAMAIVPQGCDASDQACASAYYTKHADQICGKQDSSIMAEGVQRAPFAWLFSEKESASKYAAKMDSGARIALDLFFVGIKRRLTPKGIKVLGDVLNSDLPFDRMNKIDEIFGIGTYCGANPYYEGDSVSCLKDSIVFGMFNGAVRNYVTYQAKLAETLKPTRDHVARLQNTCEPRPEYPLIVKVHSPEGACATGESPESCDPTGSLFKVIEIHNPDPERTAFNIDVRLSGSSSDALQRALRLLPSTKSAAMEEAAATGGYSNWAGAYIDPMKELHPGESGVPPENINLKQVLALSPSVYQSCEKCQAAVNFFSNTISKPARDAAGGQQAYTILPPTEKIFLGVHVDDGQEFDIFATEGGLEMCLDSGAGYYVFDVWNRQRYEVPKKSSYTINMCELYQDHGADILNTISFLEGARAAESVKADEKPKVRLEFENYPEDSQFQIALRLMRPKRGPDGNVTQLQPVGAAYATAKRLEGGTYQSEALDLKRIFPGSPIRHDDIIMARIPDQPETARVTVEGEPGKVLQIRILDENGTEIDEIAQGENIRVEATFERLDEDRTSIDVLLSTQSTVASAGEESSTYNDTHAVRLSGSVDPNQDQNIWISEPVLIGQSTAVAALAALPEDKVLASYQNLTDQITLTRSEPDEDEGYLIVKALDERGNRLDVPVFATRNGRSVNLAANREANLEAGVYKILAEFGLWYQAEVEITEGQKTELTVPSVGALTVDSPLLPKGTALKIRRNEGARDPWTAEGTIKTGEPIRLPAGRIFIEVPAPTPLVLPMSMRSGQHVSHELAIAKIVVEVTPSLKLSDGGAPALEGTDYTVNSRQLSVLVDSPSRSELYSRTLAGPNRFELLTHTGATTVELSGVGVGNNRYVKFGSTLAQKGGLKLQPGRTYRARVRLER